MISGRPRALFVCRGSVADGLGHVIRTRAVIEAAAPQFDLELIVIGDELPRALLADMPHQWRLVDDEDALLDAAADLQPDVVVFDLVALSERTVDRITKTALTVSLSPVFDQLARMNLVFNRTRYGLNGDESRGGGRHYGVDYAIVRPECRRIDTGTFADHLDDDVISIAISMGGSDAPNRTLEVLNALRPLGAPATFWVLLGEGYGHSYRDLVECVRRDHRHEIILAKTNRSMWRILRNCSIAILAGGVTTYEAVFAGLPSVNVLAEKRDRFLIRELVEHSAAFDGGTFDEPGLETLRTTVEQLIADREALLGVHRASRGLVDGRGAERVVQRILSELAPQPRHELEAV